MEEVSVLLAGAYPSTPVGGRTSQLPLGGNVGEAYPSTPADSIEVRMGWEVTEVHPIGRSDVRKLLLFDVPNPFMIYI